MRSLSRVMFTIAFLVAVLMAGGLRLAEAGVDVWTSLNSGLTDTNVETLVIDPTTPTTLYAGTWYAGVFKSTNGGADWSPADAGLPAKAITALVIDPTTPTTLYAGTWDGVFKSTDGGGHWSAVNAGWNGVPIYALAIDPLTPTTLYAGTRHGGVLKSTDGAGHWSAVNAGLTGYGYYVSALAIDPLTPTTLYAGTDGPAVFKSTNGGENWVATHNGIPASCRGMSFAIDPLTPTTVYVGAGCGTGSGVFKSTNGGSSWNAVNSGMPGWYSAEAIAINHLTLATLYRGGTDGVFKSTNAGENWNDFNTGLTSHDVHALAVDPVNAATLYAGTLGGGVFAIQPAVSLAAAILPGSRSVQVGTPATAFVTVINAGASTATGVGISPQVVIPASFAYQTTDPLTNVVTGTPNTPADIPPGQAHTYVVALWPTAPFGPTDVAFAFAGSNTAPVATLVGVNTLLLSASATPVSDIVALAATLNNDGIVNIPSPGSIGIFAVATVNVGAPSSITATTDTGAGSPPVTMALCQTSATGSCLQPPGPSVTTQIDAGQTPTFGVFVTAMAPVPFDPATNRIFVRFKDSANVTRGATSVAVRTQ